MLLVAIAWLYVVLMIAVVEATSSNGTVFGAVMTVTLYGVLPIGLVAYLFFSPARRRARRAESGSTSAADASETAIPRLDPDGGDHAAGNPVAPVREEP